MYVCVFVRCSKKQRLHPFVFGTLCSFVVVAFGVIGLMSTEQFDKNISGSSGVSTVTTNMLDDVTNFFSRMDVSLGSVSTQAENLTPSIKASLANFTDLTPGLPGLQTSLRNFGNDLSTYNPVTVYQVDPTAASASTNPLSFECTVCSAIQSTVNDAVSSLDSNGASTTYSQVASTKSAALSKVVDSASAIQSAITGARKQISDVNQKATDFKQSVSDVNDQVSKYEPKRRAVVIVIYLLPLFLVLLYWIFGVVKKETGMKIVLHCSFFSGSVLWLIFAIHLPFALLVADSCYYLDVHDVDLAGTTSLANDITAPLTACLAQQDLLSAFNVSANLDYTTAVVFPVVPNADALLNATALTSLNNQVQSLSVSSFSNAYDSNDKYAQLGNMNALTNIAPYFDYFVLANTSTCIPAKYIGQSIQVQSYRNIVLTALRAESQFQVIINGAQMNMTRVMNQYQLLQNRTVKLLTVDMPSLQSNIDPLIKAGNNVKTQSYCSPLDQDYGRLKSTFCSDVLTSVSGLAFSSFFAAIFVFGMNVSSWYLIHRLQHPVTNAQADSNVGRIVGQQSYVINSGATPAPGEYVHHAVNPHQPHHIELAVASAPVSPTGIAVPASSP